MIELRPYQQDLLQQVQTALATDTKARVMMQLPTGGGKTIIAGALLADWLTGGRKAVWLTHRRELAEQTCRMLNDAHISAMTDVKWTPGTDAPAMSGGAVILMAQTVGRRTDGMEVWDGYNADDLMMIDEAHHAAAEGWERAMGQWPGRIVDYPFLGQLSGIAHRCLDGLAGDRRVACRDFFWIQIRREVVEDCGHEHSGARDAPTLWCRRYARA